MIKALLIVALLGCFSFVSLAQNSTVAAVNNATAAVSNATAAVVGNVTAAVNNATAAANNATVVANSTAAAPAAANNSLPAWVLDENEILELIEAYVGEHNGEFMNEWSADGEDNLATFYFGEEEVLVDWDVRNNTQGGLDFVVDHISSNSSSASALANDAIVSAVKAPNVLVNNNTVNSTGDAAANSTVPVAPVPLVAAANNSAPAANSTAPVPPVPAPVAAAANNTAPAANSTAPVPPVPAPVAAAADNAAPAANNSTPVALPTPAVVVNNSTVNATL